MLRFIAAFYLSSASALVAPLPHAARGRTCARRAPRALAAPAAAERRHERRRRPGAPAAAAAVGLLAMIPAAAHAADLATLGAPLDSVFLQSTSLIFLSEIGDKTFFIASILAAKASRLVTFVGSFGALVLMTVISVLIGQIFHAVPDSVTGGLPIDDYVAVASFLYFGVTAIRDSLANDEAGAGMAEELEDAETVLREGDVLEKTKGRALKLAGTAFALTVVAEIGDRSQFATIALSAAQNPYLVCAGACFGHGLATGIAVVGGAFISKYTNEKTVGLVGGVLFLIFAATTALGTF